MDTSHENDGSVATASSDMLEQEKFDGLNELAQLSVQIGTARGALTALQADTENYLMTRDLEVKARVNEILRNSKELLDKASENHAELKRYHADLKGFAATLTALSEELGEMGIEFKENTESVLADLNEKMDQVNETKRTNDAEFAKIASDKETLTLDKVEIENQKRAIRDQRETLARGFNELKAKQKKHG